MGLAEELDLTLRGEAELRNVPGAAAGLLVDGELITASYGVTNINHPLPMTSGTLFQVASITKTFTAAAVMLLVEEGRLALDDPVGEHLPDLGAQTGLDTNAITIEHLLSHRAGFDGDHLFISRADDLVALRDARRLFEPGAAYSYNNAAFSVAGAVIEAASGEPFETFMRTRLLRPLGMKSAGFRADDAITHRVAAPHFVEGDRSIVLRRAGWQPGWELTPVDRPAGGLISCVDHLLVWARFQLDGCAADGTRLLSRESLERLHTPVVRVDLTEECALDWTVCGYDGVTTISHGGLTVGYCSTLAIAPGPGVAVVSLTHATNGGAVNEAVRRFALSRAGIDVRDPVPDPSIRPDPAALTGEFVSPFARLTLRPGHAPGTVVVASSQRDDVAGWQPPPEPDITFGFFAPDHAVAVDRDGPAAIMRLGTGPAGRTDWVMWGGRRSPRVG